MKKKEIIERLKSLRDNAYKTSTSETVKVLDEVIGGVSCLKDEPKECMYSKDNYTDEDRKALCDGCEEDCKLNKKLLKKIEQRSWSEEDEELCEHLIKTIEASDPLPTSIYSDCKRWLKSLKDRVGCEVNCTTTKEWSEEDKIIRNALIKLVEMLYESSIYKSDKNRLLDWLKSLRPQSTWKPSEEQIKLLQDICGYNTIITKKEMGVLESLLEQLKKLKE